MNTITIDTYGISRRLQEKGFSREQTEGLIEAAREIDLDRIVTKEFLETKLAFLETKLENNLEKLELRMTVRLGTMIFALGGLLIAVKFL